MHLNAFKVTFAPVGGLLSDLSALHFRFYWGMITAVIVRAGQWMAKKRKSKKRNTMAGRTQRKVPSRNQATIPNRWGIRYKAMAAIADFEQFRDVAWGTVIVRLALKGLEVMYGRRRTLPKFLAELLSDPKYDWAEDADPLGAFAKVILVDDREVEKILLGMIEPTSEHLAAIAGVLREEDEGIFQEILEDIETGMETETKECGDAEECSC